MAYLTCWSFDYLKLTCSRKFYMGGRTHLKGMELVFVLILLGIVLIGLGLVAQGWFILDMNKRFSRLLGQLLVETRPIEENGDTHDD